MRAAFFIAVLLVISPPAGAQHSAPPVASAPSPGGAAGETTTSPRRAENDTAVSGTGVIRGRVVRSDTGQPLRQAIVRARADESHSVLTDEEGDTRRRQPDHVGGARVDDRGEFRVFGLLPGEYYLSASATASHDLSGASAGYVPTYYPGTPVRGEAQRIAIKAGEEIAATGRALS